MKRSLLGKHAMHHISVRVPATVVWRLGYMQIQLGVGRNTIVRRAIVEWLERNQSTKSVVESGQKTDSPM